MRSLRSFVLVLIPAFILIILAGCGSGTPAGTSSSTPGAGSGATGATTSSDFSLAVAPASPLLTPGATGVAIHVSATAVGTFSGTVSVNLGSLPAGVSASPATLTLTPGNAQTITLTAAANAAPVQNATVTLTGTSGSLSHTATATISVAAVSFTLSLTPAAQTIAIGNTSGAQVAVTANAVNGFAGSVQITLTGLPAGVTANPSTLTLVPGAAQSVTLSANYMATTGPSTVSFNGVDGTLTADTSLALTVQKATVADVVTYHYDNARDGLNAQETILTPSSVTAATFGKTGFYAADGKVDAAPLFAAQVPVSVGSNSTTNVVYMASEHDTVYAYNTANGNVLWQTSILGTGETPGDVQYGCTQIAPEVGITATPVIDRGAGPNGTIFVVGMTKTTAGGAYHQRLHALDLVTGAEQPGSPTDISAVYPGSGAGSSHSMLTFDPGQYAERVGLLLLNGSIYTGWTSHCDQGLYTGWVIGFNESSLQESSVIDLTPNGSEGAIWMSGDGLAADTSNNIYLLDANGSFQDTFTASGFPSDSDYGNGMIKLSTGSGLAVADFFEPYNTDSESNGDVDLGSGGAMLLPDQVDASGNTRHLLVGAGKDGNLYVADRDNMGKFNANNNSNLYQEIPNALANGAWSGPAYFNGTVYYAGQGDVLKAFPISKALLATTPSSKSSTTFGYPGSTPSVSANGTSNGIVWALESGTGSPAVLHAYEAANLSNELYNSNQTGPSGTTSTFGSGNKFITPVVANGNVYVGTPTGVAVFGLLH